MLVILASALFAVVFTRAITGYIRTRDRLQGAVALVFCSVGALFLVGMSRVVLGEVPTTVRVPALVLLYGQPVLTFGLVALIRPVSRVPAVLATLGWAASSVSVVLIPVPQSLPVTLTMVGWFCLMELVAAGYLLAEARQRSGAAQARIGAAAVGTALFGVVLVVAAVGVVMPQYAAQMQPASRLIALAPAVAYVVAFVPSGWLRRQWSARTAYTLIGRLLAASPSATPREVWQHYADIVLGALAAEGTVVLVHDRSAGFDGPVAVAGTLPEADLWELAKLPPEPGSGPATHDPAMHGSATHGSARWTRIGGRRFLLITIPVRMHNGAGAGTLLVFGLHRTLFTEDDIVVLADLGKQATVLADRGVLTGRLTASVGALRAANEAKSDFVAAMSHELRTPLNAIIGFSELMGLEEMAGDRRIVPDEWITNVHSSGRHLLGLINDVLDLAKVEAGRVELRVEPIDVGTAVAEAVAPLTSLIDAKKLRLSLAAPPELVTADRLRLRQMLNNLLSNAIKFTPEAGAIYVAAHREGAEVHLSVADTGPGIAPADQALVFDEFHQAGDHESRATGTGLGLALTRRLAEAHGGRVELWSEPGRGSRFTLVLPAAGPTGPGPDDDHRAGPAGARPGGVLVIEDDPAAAELLRTYLSGAGYGVRLASSGEAGITLARECSPDVILLDVLLPGMDGWAVLQKLKGDQRLRHIPVLVVTVVDEREVGLALGAVDYFVKPVERGALLSWLARNGVAPEQAEQTCPAAGRVLVADGDATSRERTAQWLRDRGLGVATAASADDLIGVARSGHYDLVLCDATLSGPGGGPLLAALGADPATRDLPLVLLHDGGLTAADGLAGLVGGPVPVLGVVARADLSHQHLDRWLGAPGRTPSAGQQSDGGPALERVGA